MYKQALYILSIVTFFSVSCKEKQAVKEEIKKFVLSDTMAKMIALDTAGSCFINDAITLTGEVSFNENTVNKIFPRNSGQVVECKVTLGDKVQAGQVLAEVKSADIAGNYADLSSANADINIAKRQLETTQSLFEKGIASEKELTEAKNNYNKTLAAKDKIQSLITINGGNKSSSGGTYLLTSPISGYIVEKKVNEGNFIRADMGDYLFTVSDLKNVWVYANVFEADIPKIKEGFEVQVVTLAYPDKIFTGKIDKMSEVLDPVNKVLKVRIKLNNDDLLLRPQMFTKVIVYNKENKKATCISNKAVITQNGRTFVVVYNSNSDMQIAEVDILKTVGDKTYIASGVKEGQKLITKNQLLIFQQLLNN